MPFETSDERAIPQSICALTPHPATTPDERPIDIRLGCAYSFRFPFADQKVEVSGAISVSSSSEGRLPRPIIGVATQTLQPIPGQAPLSFVMGQQYIRALTSAGAIPWIIPLLTEDEATLREIYDRIDGLFLAGGVDVEPAVYGEPRAEC